MTFNQDIHSITITNQNISSNQDQTIVLLLLPVLIRQHPSQYMGDWILSRLTAEIMSSSGYNSPTTEGI